MIRTQGLRRKTPMARGPATLKRAGRIRPVSAAKAAWKKLYAAALALAKAAQEKLHGSTVCERCKTPGPVDGHHPGGQNGKRILVFRLICRVCHDWIHFESPREARKEGWLE